MKAGAAMDGPPNWVWDLAMNDSPWLWTIILVFFILAVLGFDKLIRQRLFPHNTTLCDDSLRDCDSSSADRRDTF